MLDLSDQNVPLAESPIPQILGDPAVVGMLKIPLVPASWNFYVLTFGAMLALAGIDFIGALFAKEWAEQHHTGFFLAGLLAFGLLFTVYAASLKVAELSVVTFGWIVFLQVGIVLLDTLRYGVRLPPDKWVVIGLLLALQAYLILAPNGESTGG